MGTNPLAEKNKLNATQSIPKQPEKRKQKKSTTVHVTSATEKPIKAFCGPLILGQGHAINGVFPKYPINVFSPHCILTWQSKLTNL
ncbi:hypothetical protein CEXT_81511 [Caerostris extrusa]|uniref:Uncharacterized protein n=1 Tax=Caerostris extrusa TaxID=172846 RepID=A0AAV4TLN3_CAEEX|nr:hypothetical protein CEXT_81511 [Caerostris extrusa]